MEQDLQHRIAANEDVFRDVNDAIARGQWPGDQDVPTRFRCECASLGCSELIELKLPEYEAVRANPRRFVLAVGHELAGVEVVVQTEPGYVVVEKVGEAGAAAEALDEAN